MMDEHRKAISLYRLERAKETLEEAQTLFSEHKYEGSMNRIYYSLFYVVTALANANGFSTAKHTGMMAWFNQHCVNTGMVSKESGQIYNQAFDLRSKGDYRDLYRVEPTVVQYMLGKAGVMIQELEHLTQKILTD